MSSNGVKKLKRLREEAGIALITTLMLMFLMSSLLAGFTILLISNQQLAGSNNDDVNAFYGAEAGMEYLTVGLGNLFTQTYAPSMSQIDALMTTPPSIPGISYTTGSGGSGYIIQTTNPLDGNGNPLPINSTISAGNYQGMGALVTDYQLQVTARTNAGREVKLQRLVETVGIPMFQFAIFCEVDCSFHAGANFTIGGRVHGNGSLFLAAGGGTTLQMQGKVDAYKDIVREYMDNGASVSANWPGTVSVTTNPGGSNYRSLATTEGSVLGSSSACNSGWPTVSTGGAPADYNHNLINGEGSPSCKVYSTGASLLNLGVVTMGNGTTYPIDLVRRPMAGESTLVTGERYFAQASLVILLSDNPADIMNLPCVDQSTQPMDLSVLAQPVVNWPTTAPYSTLKTNMTAYGTIPLPLAASGSLTGGYNSLDGYWLPNQAPIIKGYLKIQAATSYAAPCGNWKDVTAEIMALGYVGRNINPVPESLDGATLNPAWPTVGRTNWPAAGQTCSATSCNQMDPLKGTGNWGLSNAATPVTPFAITNAALTSGLSYNLPNPASSQVGPEFGGATTPGTTLYTGTQTCADPHPNAIIRLERIRDNPSSLYSYYKPVSTWVPYVSSGVMSAANKPQKAPMTLVCGVDPVSGALPTIYDAAGNAGTWVPQPWDFWNNTLFDTREGDLRDVTPNAPYSSLPTLNGTMHYVELDVNNLTKWFSGAIGSSGALTKDPVVSPNDFSVYFSDRRGNYTTTQTWSGWPPVSPSGHETGEYGWNDFANSNTDPNNGCPNSGLDGGEDLDGTGTFFNYGALKANENYIMGYVAPGYTTTIPLTGTTAPTLYNYNSTPSAGQVPPVLTGTSTTNGTSPTPYGEYGFYPVATTLTAANGPLLANPNCGAPTYTNGVWPMMYASSSQAARENPPIFYRRALKLVNGNKNIGATLGPCPSGANCGLAISTENPVYIQGDYNANSAGGGFNDPSTGTSVAADSVTILSNSWNDVNSFSYNLYLIGAPRIPVNTYYRTAIIAGKGASFPEFAGNADNGTDGGIHNFLRYIEAWGNGGLTVNYLGAIVNLFTNRQATGLFKCCTAVYSVPTRNYAFDSCFLTPSCLPPRTPLFHDVDTTGWTRLQLASQ